VYPAVPIIDGTRCDGCNACVGICPEAVLILINEPAAGKYYKVSPEYCTACHLCIDVCDAEAIRVEPMSSSLGADILLENHQCRACGVRYHMPDSHFPMDGLCRICLQTNHHKKLFQVRE
jgi:ferredoxin